MKKTAKYYASHPESRAKKQKYDAKFNGTPAQKKKRAELNKYNRDAGTYGNGDGRDASHHGGKITGFEKASENRGDKNNSAGDRRARGKKK